MSCNSAIYVGNNANSALTTTTDTFVTIPLGSILRRFGRNLNLEGNSVIACGSGYFDCEATITLTPTAAGLITVQLFQDGAAVPRARASATGVAATTIALPITALVRNCGCDCNSAISLGVNNSCAINNVALVVEKI